MSRSDRSSVTSVRALGALLLAVAVLSSLTVTSVTSVAAATSSARAADIGTAGTRGADFPVLPKRCYDPYRPAPILECSIVRSGKNRPTMVLWGDSHSWQYLPAIQAKAEKRRVNLVFFAAGGCPPTLKSRGGRNVSCDNTNRAAFDHAVRLKKQGHKVRVLLGSFWSYYRIGYQALQRGERDTAYREHLFRLQHNFTKPLFKALANARVPFDLIGQSASVPEDAPTCRAGDLPYQCPLPRQEVLPLEKDTRTWLRDLAHDVRGRHQYLDTSVAYCDEWECSAVVDDSNVYYDRIHLGADLTATMSTYFTRPFARLAPRQ